MTTSPAFTATACFEPLESRTLLSTSYDFMSLMGYNRLGASWKYSTTGTVVGPTGQSESLTQSGKITIGSKKVKYDNQLSTVAKLATSDLNLTTAWYSTAKGTFQSLSAFSAEGNSLSINLHDTCIAPKAMQIGQTFKDAGTFDGSLSIDYYGDTITGTFSGKDSVSSSLSKKQTVKTRAGTFSTIKGTYTVTTTGKMKLKYLGQSVTLNFTAVETATFWAVPNVGEVKQVASMNIALSGYGQSFSSTVNETSTLISYTLP
jgi:hypothetical protein